VAKTSMPLRAANLEIITTAINPFSALYNRYQQIIVMNTIA
jgi:hypothetical protein